MTRKQNAQKKARKTVAAPVTVTPVAAPTSMIGDVLAMLKAAGLAVVPAGAGQAIVAVPPAPVPVVPQPRKRYSAAKVPVPPFGESALTVYTWLKAHSPATQRELEEGTGLTEGQIKGAIRQLTLAGYVGSERADS